MPLPMSPLECLGFDLLAGTAYGSPAMLTRTPTVLVFDSGLGGLTVFAELRLRMPAARFVYVADDAAFPYGALDDDALVTRVGAVMERVLPRYEPDAVVIACNTASTLVLPPLRARFPVPFVGTVPAVKPAALVTRTGRIAVLATPGTVRRDYTRALIETYASDLSVTLVGAPHLASLAEAHMKGEAVSDADVAAEIAPCFVDEDGRRTDVVVLACTHFPLLVERFEALAPWPVTFIDPAPAIARRTGDLVGQFEGRVPEALMLFTGDGRPAQSLRRALADRGLSRIESLAMPLLRH